MLTVDPTGRYIFVPSEVGSGAGVFRYDTVSGQQLPMMVGNDTGVRTADPKHWNPRDDDYSRFDPATFTPWGTVITGEETTGGRFFEIFNPLKLPDGIPPQVQPFLPPPLFQTVWQSSIPAVAHEGLQFDSHGVLYFIDEDNSGSLYKFVPLKAGRLDRGQTFVLRVHAFNGNPAQVWNSPTNIGTVRSGPATWVPMTDEDGDSLTAADPFAFVTTTGGRSAADELVGTPYGRPEDMSMGTLANGNEVAYIAITSENLVIALELVSDTTAVVHDFVRRGGTTDEATGLPVAGGSAGFNSPDNMETARDGTVYIIEDSNPGDIWRARDANRDGVAESIGRWASLGVSGSEPTGMISDPNDPKRFYVVVQHPSSDNDAIWAITMP
jgi:secreted PhoX family phosphatase